jgi:trimethylamine--corrinoid protein Co-methyltransferase
MAKRKDSAYKDSAFKMIEKPVIERIIETAFQLLQKPGLKVYNDHALKLFDDAGAEVDIEAGSVKLPRALIEDCLKTIPSTLTLHDLKGKESVYLEENNFHPYPGTTAINIYDYEKRQFREAASKDLKDFIKLVEQLPYIPVTSSFVCKDVPENFTDIYRMGLAFKHSKKPIKTSVFTSKDAIPVMIDLFAAIAGGQAELKGKPFGFVSVNADPPLMWNDFITEVLIECAKSKIPLSLGSMPISGAAAPVTVMGSLIQHAAESLSGIALSQIVQPGAPGLYGSSPIIFDVRKGTTPMGAIETLMFNSGCAQIGKFLDMPTQLYMGLSDAKVIDTQVGYESAMGILLGALSGANLFAVGMLNFETALTLENMVIANEIAGNAYRLLEGIDASEEHFTTDIWEEVGHHQDFLGTMHTISHFEKEQFNVSALTDRDSETEWEKKGSRDTAERAHDMVKELLSANMPKVIDSKVEEEIDGIVVEYANKLGINREQLPQEFFTD